MNHIPKSIISSSRIDSDLDLIRKVNPIIHNITNWVAMATSANVLLAIGASPIMAHARHELIDISQLSQALVINIGTLDEAWISSIETAHQNAIVQKIPIVFDPVGAGASQYRTQTAKNVLARGVNVLRGNASEIIALACDDAKPKGVDAHHDSMDAISAARALSIRYHCVVVVSGAIDIIVDKEKKIFNHHGTSLFTKVTAMGCSVTALIGAFTAINSDYFLAALHAMVAFTMAGEIAATHTRGPGSFYPELLDALSNLNFNHLSINLT